MAKAFILLIGVCAYAAQGSVLRNEGGVLKRHARSPAPCDECDSPGFPAPPPPPPPPGIPPVFHTEQWSGLTHSNGGQGVFSGAAASIDGGKQTGSQAFSLASATGGDGEKGTVAPELLNNRFGFDKDSDSFGQSSGGDFGAQGVGFGGGKKFSGSKSSFKESHFSVQSGDLQFGKGFGFKDGDIFHHHQFYKPGRGLGSFEGAGNGHGGFGDGSSSHSSSYASSGSNNEDSGAIHFGGQDSNTGDLSAQFGQTGSGFGGGSSSASSANSAFSGNQQQQQQLQSGFGSRVQGSGFSSTGRFESGSQNGQLGQSGSSYHSFGKTNGFSSSEQQQQQNLQLRSQRGYESSGASGLRQSGFGSGGQFDSGSSAFGSQNSHVGGQDSNTGDLSAQFGQSGSGFGGGSSSVSSANSAFSGSQQQQLQSGFGSGVQGSGFSSTGQFGSGSQNGQLDQSGSGYHTFGKTNGFSSSEQQQQQNVQLGSQRGFEPGGASGHQQSGFGSGGQFESVSSAFGSQNSHIGQSGSGYGQSNGFNANEQQQQQNIGQLQSGSDFGTGSASSASSSSSTGNQQLQHGSQTGLGSNGGSQSQGTGFGSAGQFVGGSSSHFGQQESSLNSFGKSDGFGDNGQQQQQLQLGSHTGFETGAGSQGGLTSGSSSSSSSQSSRSSSGSYGGNQQEQSELHTGIGGALQLAAQGLKQAQEQNSGCSTCGKSTYALSNAKSHSGSAIALSVAG